MRILDRDHDQKVDQVTIYLTRSEAMELRDGLEHLLEAGRGVHEHVNAEDFQKEITICLYEPNSIDEFDDRSRRLLTDDV
jgi:hypothetical protein